MLSRWSSIILSFSRSIYNLVSITLIDCQLAGSGALVALLLLLWAGVFPWLTASSALRVAIVSSALRPRGAGMIAACAFKHLIVVE
jgi:hypothetical protein